MLEAQRQNFVGLDLEAAAPGGVPPAVAAAKLRQRSTALDLGTVS
jgi:hypothetical protein